MSDEGPVESTWAKRLREQEEFEKTPEYQAQKAEEERKRAAALFKAALREMERIEAPAKDLALIGADAVTRTKAIETVEATDWRLMALSGGPGSGKTMAGTWWLWLALRPKVYDTGKYGGWMSPLQPYPLMFATAARLSRWAKYDEEQMRKLLRAERLVVDDLGAEFMDEKGSYLSLLDEVVNERYANNRPTLLTTNLEAQAFRERYGERIADRIRECGRFVSVGNKSMRRKEAA